MKFAILITATAFSVFTISANADIIPFDLSGQLGVTGLPIHDAFDGASFSGTVEVDTSVITFNQSNFINYGLAAYKIDVISNGGDVISFFGDGEVGEDASGLSVGKTDGLLGFYLYENIDNPATGTLEQRQLQINFDADTNGRVNSLDELLLADPIFGQPSNFNGGLLQFSTSQFPTDLASATASLTAVQPSTVPLPAGGILLLSGLAGITGLRKRNSRN